MAEPLASTFKGKAEESTFLFQASDYPHRLYEHIMYMIYIYMLERGPLSLVSTTEELLDRKVAAPV
jgi:hypothetical protein